MKEDGFGFVKVKFKNFFFFFKELLLKHLSKSEIQLEIL